MLNTPHLIPEILHELYTARQPVIIYGAGIRLAKAEAEARTLIEMIPVPVIVTWGAADLMPHYGTFGTHGLKAANLAVQNADYILAVGTRLDTKATGSPASSFAPKARLVMVDIDQAELDKMKAIGRPLYRSVCEDAKYFLSMLAREAENLRPHEGYLPEFDSYLHWHAEIGAWQLENPPGPGRPYDIMRELSDRLREDDVIVSDTGCALAWAMQALELKGRRFIHAWNQTPMGYGLPAAIGAAFASPKGRVILLTGDGGLSVNIGELATVAHHALPIKIILFNNKGHAMCRQTQRQWLDSRYCATDVEDLAFPDFLWVAGAYKIRTPVTLERLLADNEPGFLEYMINPDQGVSPQIKFGEPLA